MSELALAALLAVTILEFMLNGQAEVLNASSLIRRLRLRRHGLEVDIGRIDNWRRAITRREWHASNSIGAGSFAAPIVVALSACYWLAGWNRDQAEIGGLALSTTSLAVVYAVLVETGLNRSVIGTRIMSATFVTDILTVIGLSVLFITPNIWVIPFVAVAVGFIWGLPKISPWFFGRYGDRVIEPEIKLVFAALFILMYLGTKADSQAVLPAFVLGLAMGAHYAEHRKEQERLRVVAFAFLTPFFFIKGGLYVSLSAVWANLGVLALLFVAKIAPKIGGVYPLARKYTSPHAAFTTLLMSTGLTFGTITSLYGLQAGIIDRTQFSLLVTVVVLSAIIPTAIAQRFFTPTRDEMAAAADPAERGSPSPPREPAADAV